MFLRIEAAFFKNGVGVFYLFRRGGTGMFFASGLYFKSTSRNAKYFGMGVARFVEERVHVVA